MHEDMQSIFASTALLQLYKFSWKYIFIRISVSNQHFFTCCNIPILKLSHLEVLSIFHLSIQQKLLACLTWKVSFIWSRVHVSCLEVVFETFFQVPLICFIGISARRRRLCTSWPLRKSQDVFLCSNSTWQCKCLLKSCLCIQDHKVRTQASNRK